MAEKTFNSAAFQKSWSVHERAFGPILNPAFVDDFKTRISLTAALNHISNGDLKLGIAKLQNLKSTCVTDADKAAWLFFMGLCFELARDKDNMLACYTQANQFQHGFYLPYLKIAKSAHNDGVFEVAEENYRAGIRCFDNAALNDNSRRVLASAYANLASCLTMMHRYEEAQDELDTSKTLLPNLPERSAAQAVLYAATEQAEKIAECLSALSSTAPSLTEPTKKMTDKILSENHPHFSPEKISAELIEAFWAWFTENDGFLREKLDREEYDDVFALLSEQMKGIFTFINRDFEFGVMPNGNVYRLEMADFFGVALNKGYNELILAHPKALDEHWEFAVVR